jgi:cob(I)alamin adenosyltransferase
MQSSTLEHNKLLINLLAERVEVGRVDLVGRYLKTLQDGLFNNRASVHPRMLKQIAADEAEAIVNFLKQAGFSGAERGEKLHQTGFNAGAILRLCQVTRQFLLKDLENHEIAPMLEIVDEYQQAIIEGFVLSVDKENLNRLDEARVIFRRGDE